MSELRQIAFYGKGGIVVSLPLTKYTRWYNRLFLQLRKIRGELSLLSLHVKSCF
ncbi:hypothetical protein [Sulfurospirillum deleyianum]|uniref:Uncharacterized protein n=1 Tax=Sulfurospirillum deleyianum (strain ATCC 51133 / DSM 6946 / 5175) TaxID=525898 RepID=D1B2A7_SULD5|nr:hypothetical protein [Sulfurospirillum deleyianum]ACZ12227.1 hypothetical protein Sdel_1204 [Sulfurospirillum deleyianum DSM 6946]